MNNNNLSPLAFHENISEQAHRMPYAYGEVFPLLYPTNVIPPFQIVVPGTATPQSLMLCDENGNDIASLSFTWYTSQKTGYTVFYSKMRGVSGYSDGRYMLRVTVNVSGRTISYYSDLFTWSNNLTGCVQLIWFNQDNIEYENGMICYENGYKNILYLNTEIGKPDYKFEEEGEERDGLFFASKQISEKKYNMTFLADESLCDCLRLIRLSDYIGIVDQYGRTYRITNFLITVKWQTQGNLASVEAEFSTDTIVKNVGRAYDEEQPEMFGIELDKEQITLTTGQSDTVNVSTLFAWQEKLLTN